MASKRLVLQLRSAGVRSGRNGTPPFLLDWTPIKLTGTAVRVAEWAGVPGGATASLHLVQEWWQIINAIREIIRELSDSSKLEDTDLISLQTERGGD